MSKKYKWLNKDSRTFLSRGYLDDGVSPEDRIRQISNRAEEILGISGFSDKFEEYMALGYFSLSTPIWNNFGNGRGLPVACYGSHIPDVTSEILYKVGEVGIMSKLGGGTSAYFGDVRSRGSKISSGGLTDGPVRFMELFDKTADVISQGSSRRGSFVAYLPVEHPDIDEFLHIKSEGNPIQNMSFAVTITDEWMNSMKSGDKAKRKLWGKIIQKKFESGYPYIMFVDNTNRQAPQVYKDKSLRINASNLCVTGDQRVVSNFGMLTAKDLADIGKDLQLFDNNVVVNSSKMQLVEEGADVYKVTLENGMSHTITDYHKVVILDKRLQKKKKPQEIITKYVECKDLRIGDSVAIQTNKGIFGELNMPKEAFLLGMYQADGTQSNDLIMIDVWENDFDLLEELQNNHDYVCDKYNTQITTYSSRIYDKPKFLDCVVSQGNFKKKRLCGKALKKSLNFEKGSVPDWIWESDEKTIWQYIRGLFYADGTVYKASSKGEPIQISLASIDKNFLKEIQLILANLGMQTSIRILHHSGESFLPDGKGSYKYYQRKDCWRLIIGDKPDALIFEKNTGFLSRKNITIEDRTYRNNSKKFYKVQSIEYLGKDDVYCCTVDSNEHLWVCNGFITHNCAEIQLFSDKDNSFVCVLSSLNLLHWDELKNTDAIETLIYFLDAVNEEFIQKTEGVKFMESAHNFAKTQRALGAGVLGWHSLLQSKMIPFESMEAKFLNLEIFETFRKRADKATEELALKLGEPELLTGYGRRNVTTMAVAPTTSSSFILGQVSQGIEPVNSNFYTQKLAKGTFTSKNPYLKELLKIKDMDNDVVWKDILLKGGSVQHLKELDENEKNVFKTFGEISQKEIVIQNIQRQKYVDQSISLNLMVPHDAKPKEVSDLMIYGWENGIKTFYYQRSTSPSLQTVRSIMECKSCES